MYSIYKIYQADKLILVTYHDITPEFTDTTKLKLIFNSPTIPISLFNEYYKSPDLFSMTTYETGIPNALDASQVVIEQSKLIGTDKPKPKTTRKSRTKKAQQSTTEG
ncbi:hypothetical protein [Acinetobacter seifertii]|uniref:hypothetical protein n=1 Tax=Acinetobacter seifertii TaxID=1530123 RepID=UPI0038625129